MNITTHTRTSDVNAATEGWDPNRCSGDDYDTERARCLFAALEADVEDEEYTLCMSQDGSGRWGLFGLSVEGHRFAVETIDAVDEGDYEYEYDGVPDGWSIAVWSDGRALVCSPGTCPEELGGRSVSSESSDKALKETEI